MKERIVNHCATILMSSSPASTPSTSTAKLAGKYLTVVLDCEAYGLNVLKIGKSSGCRKSLRAADCRLM